LAAGKSMENYRTFASQAANQQGMLGLMGQDLSGRMALNQQGFQSEMSAESILNQANQSLYNFGAQTLGTIGAGLNQIGMQKMKTSDLQKMMGTIGSDGKKPSWADLQGASMAGNVFG